MWNSTLVIGWEEETSVVMLTLDLGMTILLSGGLVMTMAGLTIIFFSKLTVTDLGESMVSWQVRPEQAPEKPRKLESASARAVSLTSVFSSKRALVEEQVGSQVKPEGWLATEP